MQNNNDDSDKALLDYFKVQAEACRQLDSPLTAGLVTHMAEDYQAGGPTKDLIGDWPTSPIADALALRLCGALHGAVLRGHDGALSAAYRAFIGGQMGTEGVWTAARAFLAREPGWVRNYLQYAPQTNEARRSILLLSGFLHLADTYDLEMDIFELGASAGLNMNWDKFYYETESWTWGSPSPVILSTDWTGPPPPTHAPLRIASRAGCDINPLDLEQEEERTRLRSYCWPDVPGRMARLDGAIKIAREAGTKPDKANAADWLETKLAARSDTRLSVVYHSIFLQYPPANERARIYKIMEEAGAQATTSAPLAWIRFEPEALQTGNPDILQPTLDLVTWPGGQRRALAKANAHVTSVTALAGE